MAKKIKTFAENIHEVENIVQNMECGELDLAEMLDQYAKGVKILAACHQQLQEAETKIHQIKENGVEADG